MAKGDVWAVRLMLALIGIGLFILDRKMDEIDAIQFCAQLHQPKENSDASSD